MLNTLTGCRAADFCRLKRYQSLSTVTRATHIGVSVKGKNAQTQHCERTWSEQQLKKVTFLWSSRTADFLSTGRHRQNTTSQFVLTFINAAAQRFHWSSSCSLYVNHFYMILTSFKLCWGASCLLSVNPVFVFLVGNIWGDVRARPAPFVAENL